MDIQGKFVIFTVIGVYLDPVSVTSLSVKWKGKTTEELTESVPFFREIVTGAFPHTTYFTDTSFQSVLKSKGFLLCH